MSLPVQLLCKHFISHHATIADALQAAKTYQGSPVTILLAPGIYQEYLTISQPFLTIEGSSDSPSVITGCLGAKEPLVDGKRGTFRTQTVFIDTHHFTAKHICFANTAGVGSIAGQALAVYADGDHLLFEHCSFLGRQDTLFTAPLPPKEIEPNGFRGPKQFAPRLHGTHLYRNCYIEGDIDFIFGGATAYFTDCTIHSLSLNQSINGYITAASTPQEILDGFVFVHCRFTSNCPPKSVYLGRPWRDFAKVAIIQCELGAHIHPHGWHDWEKTQAHDTTFFAECQNTGAGASIQARPEWIHRLSSSRADEILQRIPNWN